VQWLPYWFGVFGRAFSSFPGFTGSSWVGWLLSGVFVFRRTAIEIKTYLQTQPLSLGWHWHREQLWRAMMKTDWKAIIAIPFFFWFGHALQIAFDDQQALIRERGQAQSETVGVQRECQDRVSANKIAFESERSELKQIIAGQKSALDVLDQQVRSQRSTIDNFGTQLIKATVEPMKITPLTFDIDNSNVSRKRARWIVNGGAIIDHKAPRERWFVAVQK
jgi:hypothetical protein